MLDFYLIRHAESEMNVNNHLISGRSTETPLSGRGIHQADLLGKRLNQERVRFDKVYSSIAVRALDTAKIVCEQIKYSLDEIIQSDQLVELSQGEWEGKLRSEIYTSEMLARINADNWNFKAPSGESQKELEERMTAYINRNIVVPYLTAEENNLGYNQITGIFSHGTAIKCFLRGIMNWDPNMTYKTSLDNTSISRLKYSKDGWRLLGMNDTAHLLGQSKIEDLGY